MKETRILLTETTFTNLCKSGFIPQKSDMYGSIDVNITKSDMSVITKGDILTKDIGGELFKIALQDIGFTLIKEIIKRSPMYSEMYYEI
jgi:hypothetical protein